MMYEAGNYFSQTPAEWHDWQLSFCIIITHAMITTIANGAGIHRHSIVAWKYKAPIIKRIIPMAAYFLVAGISSPTIHNNSSIAVANLAKGSCQIFVNNATVSGAQLNFHGSIIHKMRTTATIAIFCAVK